MKDKRRPEAFFIDAPHLILREVNMADGEDFLSAMACPEIAAMHSGGFKTIAEVRRYTSLLAKEYHNGKHRTLAVAGKASNELYGTIVIDMHKHFPRAELGYWIAAQHRNKGYATEAVRAAIAYGFSALNLRRVQAVHSVDNPASGRVLEKAGMTFEGVLRQYGKADGEPCDMKIYAIIKSDMTQERQV